jgi:hypothetical protein
MKNNLKTYLSIMFLIFGSIQLSAQQATSTAGGEATGSQGSVSFTVGQTDYSSSTGTNGSVSRGVQQPFVISDTNISVNKIALAISLNAYPNPTNDVLTLETEKNAKNLSYQLFDINGKILSEGTVSESKTEIQTKDLVAATYFLHIMQKNEPIKTFKIIKN